MEPDHRLPSTQLGRVARTAAAAGSIGPACSRQQRSKAVLDLPRPFQTVLTELSGSPRPCLRWRIHWMPSRQTTTHQRAFSRATAGYGSSDSGRGRDGTCGTGGESICMVAIPVAGRVILVALGGAIGVTTKGRSPDSSGPPFSIHAGSMVVVSALILRAFSH